MGAQSAGNRYSFELLQYAPNFVSSEHFNIGVLLYDENGKMLDARMAADFQRLRCHPLTELPFLEALRNEFEERRLFGEGFSGYAEAMLRNLATTLRVSERRVFSGGDQVTEMARLYRTYVATPPRPADAAAETAALPGSRRALRGRMDEVFGRHHLLGGSRGLDRDVSVSYGGPRLRFTFDYACQPNGAASYIHGLALRNDASDAAKLCFAFERLRAAAASESERPALTAVLDDGIEDDIRDLLGGSKVAVCEASELDRLAADVRRDLGL